MIDSNALPDHIADCVLDKFEHLPAKRKPRERDGNSREWVPLSGIVLSRNGKPLRCVALGTGMKCLPASKLPEADGNVLHDWHAEVVAIRAFNRFLIDECAHVLAAGPRSSKYLQIRDQDAQSTKKDQSFENQPFEIINDVGIHMYCSEVPCGDASMELTMQAQDDATPWKSPPIDTDLESEQSSDLYGRGYFSALGVVRRKPSRSDAPVTLSKSCTDKLTLKQCTSLLSSLTSLLIHPGHAYLSSLIVPASQHVPTATTRAFAATGRMQCLQSDKSWAGGYSFHPFRVKTTDREFTYSRRSAINGQKLVPSNLSTVWTPGWQETLIGGCLQGKRIGNLKGASKISRRGTWSTVAEMAAIIGVPALTMTITGGTYNVLKESEMLRDRKTVKDDVKRQVLKGWVKNEGDDKFKL